MDFFDSYLNRCHVLDDKKKICAIASTMDLPLITFQGRSILTKELAATVLGVSPAAIDDCLASSGHELGKFGYEVLRGNTLKAFMTTVAKYESGDLDLAAMAKAPQLGIFTVQSFLDLVMIIRTSPHAALLRDTMVKRCAQGLPRPPKQGKGVLRLKASEGKTTTACSTEGHTWMAITRAISIRQPYVEQILQGKKTEEYRSMKTNIRERVYLYASLQSDVDDPEDWFIIDAEPGSLPVGLIVGSVEIVDCYWQDDDERFAYVLERPKRLESFLKPRNQPQPKFWLPVF